MISKKMMLTGALILLFNNVQVKAFDKVAAEQFTAAASIPLSCLETYLEDQSPLVITRRRAFATALTSVVRLANCYFQQTNNSDDAYFVGNEHRVYLGWAVYDALRLLTSCYNLYMPVIDVDVPEREYEVDPLESDELFFDEVSDDVVENVAKVLHVGVSSSTKLARQVLTLAEGTSTLIASMYSSKVNTKNIRSICYSLSSCLRLGKQLLSQNSSTTKKVVGVLLVLNSVALIRNIIEDKDAVVVPPVPAPAPAPATAGTPPESPEASAGEEEEVPLRRRRARTTTRTQTRRTGRGRQTSRRTTQEVVEEEGAAAAEQPASPHLQDVRVPSPEREGDGTGEGEGSPAHSEHSDEEEAHSDTNTPGRRWDAERRRYVRAHEPWRQAHNLRTAAERHKK